MSGYFMNLILQRNLAIGIVLLPLIMFLYYLGQPIQAFQNAVFHYYYVGISATTSFWVGIFAYREYRRSGHLKVYLLAVGFIGVAILYGFHGLITPGKSIADFPSMRQHINAFVFFGDMSRLWIAATFIPQTFIAEQKHQRLGVWPILLASFLLIVISVSMLMHPSSFPEVKYATGIDTFFAIIIKVITIVFLSITVARYVEGWVILRNVPLLAFATGAALIAETPVIFMLSQPWGQAWWLAHNIYAASFLVIGFGLYYSMRYKEVEFFDVAQQVNKFVQKISQQKAEIERHNFALQKELVEVGDLQKRSMLLPYANLYVAIDTIYIPHSFASGDSYDFIWDEERSVLGGVIYDVMGHGVITALQTSALKVFYRQSFNRFSNLTEQLTWINSEVVKLGDERFVAALLFEFDFKNSIVCIASAGIPYCYKATANHIAQITIRGNFLGIMDDPEFDEITEQIIAQECYIFCSDGLYDFFQANGSDNFDESVKKIKGLSGGEYKDDIAALIVKVR